MRKPQLLLLIYSMILLSLSCDRKVVFEKNSIISDSKWNFKETLHYDVNINDTLRAHNIYINIRNSQEYQYNNIFLFLSTYAPNGNLLKDTFEISLADKKGKWYGKGAGNIYSLQVPYMQNIKFPYRGIYVFEIQHAMWNEELNGITDVGIRIEERK